jgi:hypothetical protein
MQAPVSIIHILYRCTSYKSFSSYLGPRNVFYTIVQRQKQTHGIHIRAHDTFADTKKIFSIHNKMNKNILHFLFCIHNKTSRYLLGSVRGEAARDTYTHTCIRARTNTERETGRGRLDQKVTKSSCSAAASRSQSRPPSFSLLSSSPRHPLSLPLSRCLSLSPSHPTPHTFPAAAAANKKPNAVWFLFFFQSYQAKQQ